MSEQFRIRHFFDPDFMDEGGFTIVTDMTNKLVGIALCSPKDQFSRKHGVQKAKDRIAMLQMAQPSFSPEDNIVAIMTPRAPWRPDLLYLAIEMALDQTYRNFGELDSILIIMQPKEEKKS
jgi:hypothetical protein